MRQTTREAFPLHTVQTSVTMRDRRNIIIALTYVAFKDFLLRRLSRKQTDEIRSFEYDWVQQHSRSICDFYWALKYCIKTTNETFLRSKKELFHSRKGLKPRIRLPVASLLLKAPHCKVWNQTFQFRSQNNQTILVKMMISSHQWEGFFGKFSEDL